MKASLYIRMVQLIVPLVFMTALVVVLAVWHSTSKTVHKNIFGSLQAVSKSLGDEINALANNKRKQLALLAQESDPSNADSFLSFTSMSSLPEKLELDFVTHKSNQESLVYFNPESSLTNRLKEQLRSLKPTSNESYITLNNRVYLLIQYKLQELAGNHIVILGMEINQNLLTELSQKSGLHLSLLQPNTAESPISTIKNQLILPNMLTSGVVTENYWELFGPSVMLGFQTLYTIEKPLLPIVGNSASIYLSINAERVSANFIKLQGTIALLALAAVIIAALLGLYVARRISKPLENLASYATSIAEGNYDKELTSSTYSSEFMQLHDAFEKMRDSVSTRETEISEQVGRDFLTPLYNRRYIKKILEDAFSQHKEFQAVIFNINDFKPINYVFGNACGDYCLSEIAKRIIALKGTAARLEGSRFFWMPNNINDAEQLDNIKQRLEHPIYYEGNKINISISMGILNCPEQASDVETLIRRLVIVIEHSIKSKGNIISYEQILEDSFLRRLDIVSKLKNALVNNDDEFSIAYQPFISLKDNSCKNVEALLRWENPQLGFVGPDEFIPLAEDAGLISDISHWVIDKVMSDINRFQQRGIDLSISINISPQDLMNKDFPSFCKKQLKKHGLLGSSICFELTESSILQDPEEAIQNLQALKSIGFKIAIDDFGTGYSSLSYLTSLPADIIKIDRSFIQSLKSTKDGKTMCLRVMQIAKDLGLTIVAEGIEEYLSLQWLTENDCDFGQGYHICKPSPFEETLTWLLTAEQDTLENPETLKN